MPISEVFTILDRLASAGCRFWLEGGWGVDALVGRQTRPHGDLDVDIDADDEGLAVSVLAELGYRVETDWRPNRVELIAPGRGWVDVHPLIVDAEGNARQAALDGGFHQFPKSYFC
jgi:lincosamide nucleotidyltransferase A/C/D/E